VPGGTAVPPPLPREGAAPLASMTWPEVARTSAGTVLAVPLGACEQHGPHLPLGTDTVVARALVEELASRRPDVVAAPALPYGASGEHAGFPGTLSIGTAALAHVVLELVRSADAFAGVVLVSGHGGNAAALESAARRARTEGRHVVAWWPRAEPLTAVTGPRDATGHPVPPDAHAGWVETALLLALRPTAVRAERAEAGETRAMELLAPRLLRHGVRAVAPSGVLGDPAGATAAAGRALFEALVADLLAAVEAEWGPGTEP